MIYSFKYLVIIGITFGGNNMVKTKIVLVSLFSVSLSTSVVSFANKADKSCSNRSLLFI